MSLNIHWQGGVEVLYTVCIIDVSRYMTEPQIKDTADLKELDSIVN